MPKINLASIDQRGARVTQVREDSLKGALCENMILESVGGVIVTDMELKAVVSTIKSAGRPLQMVFVVPPEQAKSVAAALATEAEGPVSLVMAELTNEPEQAEVDDSNVASEEEKTELQ